jgi:hypothetical protein
VSQAQASSGLATAAVRRYPAARIYLMGTSRGTFDAMHLAEYLSHRIAGEIHTSSMSDVANFDAKKYANRQLLVHHRLDTCRLTPYHAAEYSHSHYGSELIVMEGGNQRRRCVRGLRPPWLQRHRKRVHGRDQAMDQA